MMRILILGILFLQINNIGCTNGERKLNEKFESLRSEETFAYNDESHSYKSTTSFEMSWIRVGYTKMDFKDSNMTYLEGNIEDGNTGNSEIIKDVKIYLGFIQDQTIIFTKQVGTSDNNGHFKINFLFTKKNKLCFVCTKPTVEIRTYNIGELLK